MTRRVKEYTLDLRAKLRLLLTREELVCYTCGDPIRIGDKIITAHNRHGRAVLRHKQCAERICMI